VWGLGCDATNIDAVLIRHGNYISIYNNLESVYVNDGQKIQTACSMA